MPNFVFKSPKYGELLSNLEAAITYVHGVSASYKKQHDDMLELHKKRYEDFKNTQSFIGKIIKPIIGNRPVSVIEEDTRFYLHVKVEKWNLVLNKLNSLNASIILQPDEITIDDDLASQIATFALAHRRQTK